MTVRILLLTNLLVSLVGLLLFDGPLWGAILVGVLIGYAVAGTIWMMQQGDGLGADHSPMRRHTTAAGDAEEYHSMSSWMCLLTWLLACGLAGLAGFVLDEAPLWVLIPLGLLIGYAVGQTERLIRQWRRSGR